MAAIVLFNVTQHQLRLRPHGSGAEPMTYDFDV
jgi:hypothetical protein